MKTKQNQRKPSENIKELVNNTGHFPSPGQESSFVLCLMPRRMIFYSDKSHQAINNEVTYLRAHCPSLLLGWKGQSELMKLDTDYVSSRHKHLKSTI